MIYQFADWELDIQKHELRRLGGSGRDRPVYDWLTEGVDMVDLREAKALLDEIN